MRARHFIALAGLAAVAAGAAPDTPDPQHQPENTLKIANGDLEVMLRDNSESPDVLSGIDSLINVKDAPGFDAFDPDGKGSSAGLNFEHVISGHANPNNAFSPRKGTYDLFRLDADSAVLKRRAEDSPWALESTLKYAVRAPYAIDFEFRCTAEKPELFGPRGYAVLFFAHYMNDVAEIPIVFRGLQAAGAPEQWISADAPPGHPDYNHGGTYRNTSAADLAYDTDHNFKLNLWSYDYPRYTQPFYYGLAAHDMVLILMFDRAYSDVDEIRFSVFKFKVPKRPRPAWDFQYVIHRVEAGRTYGFRGRLIWKKFVSPGDCMEEYLRWKQSLASFGS